MIDFGPHFALLDEALDEALDLHDAARAAFLEGFAEKHPQLASRLHALLDAATGVDGPLDTAPLLVADDEAEQDDAWLGARLGPYEVVECVGEGGMGRVYRARRVDGAYDADVAIKRLRDPAGLAASRFEAERTILASLDHPGVSRLLDAGTYEGAPYLVMDFVVGQTLVEFAKDRALDRRARIDLLAQVCDAVAYAHEHLVVHRDLKPSNILVRDDGRAVLLDFGIAKLLDPGGEETRTEHRMFSPRWAAPEQVRGEFVGPRTDIYALGLLLRALLVDDDRPARGDLRFVLERALAPDPDDRYPTARELETDLRALRSGQVVAARPGRLYRAQRFVVRHAAWVFAGLLSVSLLVAYTVSVVQQRAQLEQERDRAEAQAKRATTSARFLEQMLTRGVQGRAVGETVDVRSVLERATTHLQDDPSDIDLLLLSARAYSVLGDVKAIALAQRARKVADRHGDPRALQALHVESRTHARARDEAAAARVAGELITRALERGGALDHSVGLGLALWAEAIDGHKPKLAVWIYFAGATIIAMHEGVWDEEFARALVGAGFSMWEMRALGAWVVGRGLAIQERLYGPFDLRVADSLQKLAHQQADIEDKRASLLRALEIERAILGPDHIWVANSLNDLGLMCQDHDPKVALEYLREAARIEQVATGAGQERRSVSRTNLAAVLREQGQLDEASQILEGLLEAQARVPTRGGIKVAYFLGLVRRDQGRTEQAIALLEQALAAAQRHEDEGAQQRVREALDPLRSAR